MKNIRNIKLQQLCEKELGLKDIILNFDNGLVYIYSDDDETADKLARAEKQIILGESGAINSFSKYTVGEWFEVINDWYNNNLKNNFIIKSHWIRIFSATKKTIKKTNPKIKKTVNKSTETIKTSPTTNLSKIPNKDIKPNKKPYTSRNKPVSKRFKIRTKGIYPLQDVSLPVFEDLLNQGYNMITLVAWSGACNYCKQRNGKTMSLSNWLSQLQHEAPVFEAFHVNSQSELKVWDKTGQLPDVYVNYEGNMR